MRSSHTERVVARVSPVASISSETVTALEERMTPSTVAALKRRSICGVAVAISGMAVDLL
ncbi:hypothetical protein AHiyo8_49860 [Arthrobacter sp. Hiyo8]|nr:hypothetical protein AHiyo8_49860 [Arthrobacter sp. Hiyo8]